MLVSKFADHLPLYRQSEIYTRQGVEIERSTLAGWVGGASELLTLLIDAIQRHVLAGAKLHADDTPMPVLAPGSGKTKTGRPWTYVRDDRPAGEDTAPSVWFAYSEDRKGEHPRPTHSGMPNRYCPHAGPLAHARAVLLRVEPTGGNMRVHSSRWPCCRLYVSVPSPPLA